MPKNPMHRCGEYLKNLYFRDQSKNDRKIKVDLLYCPSCNIYVNTDHTPPTIEEISKYQSEQQ